MAKVTITDDALAQSAALPLRIQARLESIVDRLEKWPQVSGVKPLRRQLKGMYRIRTGDYRIVFEVSDKQVTITRIDRRKDVYED